jgi:cell division transport system ATP-binding protein
MIKLLNVTYHYNGSAGVEGISFEIQPGEFVLLVGRTGAGKSTVIKLISLELLPASGDIFLERYHARDLKRRDYPAWRRRIGVVFQDFRLLSDRTVHQNVKLAACCEPSLRTSPKTRALKALSSVGLTPKLHSLPGELSMGERQRASIARALVNEPFVLLADEPVSNLDSETAGEVVALLQKFNKAGTAMLVATHQPERFAVCNPRIMRLERGRMAVP